jgi:hypothetical protein
MFPPRARESFHTVHARSIAIAMTLMLLAVGGVFAVRELTRPAPHKPVPTIVVDPGGGKRDGGGERRARREARERRERREQLRRREQRRERARERREAAGPSQAPQAPAPTVAPPAPQAPAPTVAPPAPQAPAPTVAPPAPPAGDDDADEGGDG